MLSPGTYYKLIPKETLANLRFRVWLLKTARTNRDFRVGLMEMCKRDVLFFINTFAWQFNPRHIGDEIGPFITWDFQDRGILGEDEIVDGERVHHWGIIECINDQKDMRLPKSREMGASWVVLMCILWLCLFHHNKKALVISRDEDAVDRPDDPDCLFWKVDKLLEYLPDWMTVGIKRRRMGFKFDRTQSFINGEASTSKAGVGGRASIALVDEFGQFDGQKGEDVYSRTADTSHCRIFVFTHKDSASMAYDLCYDSKYATMRESIWHWSQHPEKKRGLYRHNENTNRTEILDKRFHYPRGFEFVMSIMPTGGPFPGLRSPWYDEECQRRPARAVSMDLDIDPRGAASQFYDAISIRELQRFCTEPLWIGTLKYNELTGQPLELMKDANGLIKLWINPKGKCEMPPMRCGAGADIAAGSGASPTCLSIGNIETGQKLLEYKNSKIFPADAAPLFMALCLLFKDAQGIGARLCWEIQGGMAFGIRLFELGYRNVYWREDEDALGQIRNNRRRPGINSSPKTKLFMHDEYRDALMKRRCHNLSKEALEETLHFVYTGTSVEYKRRGAKNDDLSGEGVHHGDVVVSDALMWKMMKDESRLIEEMAEKAVHPCTMEYRLLEHMKRREDDLVWSM